MADTMYQVSLIIFKLEFSLTGKLVLKKFGFFLSSSSFKAGIIDNFPASISLTGKLVLKKV